MTSHRFNAIITKMMDWNQREGLSKYLYDLSKLSFVLVVLGSLIAKPPFNPQLFWVGVGITVGFAVAALYLSKKEEKKNG